MGEVVDDARALIARAFQGALGIGDECAAEAAEDVVYRLAELARAFKVWSDAPGSEMPNRLLVRFGVVEGEVDAGTVEVVIRRVRPGCTAYETLLALSGVEEGK